MNCVFCKIRDGLIPSVKLFEDDMTLAFMDVNPISEGHLLVIPKQHSANLFEIPEADLAAVATMAKRLAIAVDKALRPDGLNLLQSNGPAAGQTVDHFHMHVIPRWMGDGRGFLWKLTGAGLDSIKATAEKIRAEV